MGGVSRLFLVHVTRSLSGPDLLRAASQPHLSATYQLPSYPASACTLRVLPPCSSNPFFGCVEPLKSKRESQASHNRVQIDQPLHYIYLFIVRVPGRSLQQPCWRALCASHAYWGHLTSKVRSSQLSRDIAIAYPSVPMILPDVLSSLGERPRVLSHIYFLLTRPIGFRD